MSRTEVTRKKDEHWKTCEGKRRNTLYPDSPDEDRMELLDWKQQERFEKVKTIRDVRSKLKALYEACGKPVPETYCWSTPCRPSPPPLMTTSQLLVTHLCWTYANQFIVSQTLPVLPRQSNRSPIMGLSLALQHPVTSNLPATAETSSPASGPHQKSFVRHEDAPRQTTCQRPTPCCRPEAAPRSAAPTGHRTQTPATVPCRATTTGTQMTFSRPSPPPRCTTGILHLTPGRMRAAVTSPRRRARDPSRMTVKTSRPSTATYAMDVFRAIAMPILCSMPAPVPRPGGMASYSI